MSGKKELGGKYVFFIFLVMIGVIILAGYKVRPGWNWVLTVAAMTVFLIAMGQHICGRPLHISSLPQIPLRLRLRGMTIAGF